MIMTESAVAYPNRPSDWTFWAAGALGILATAVAAILPVLVGVWQKQAGLQVDQAGFVAATELFAQVAGTGMFLWASPRWTLRTIAVAGLCVMVVGNIATAGSVGFSSLMVARGIGGGGGRGLPPLFLVVPPPTLSPGPAVAPRARPPKGFGPG